MSGYWDEYSRRVAILQEAGDSERLRLTVLHQAGFDCHETEPERSLALFTQGRDESLRLNEPWWALFFEGWRQTALTSYVVDFSRALPLSMELMVRFNAPEGRAHNNRISVLTNVLCTYSNVDPLGYRDELERGFAHLDGEVSEGPGTERFVLNYRWVYYLNAAERWDEAYDRALRSLALVERSQGPNSQVWHGAWALFELCRTCHALGRADELAGHAEHMAALSKKHNQLRRTLADAWAWRAVTRRAAGKEKDASHAFHRGLQVLSGLDRRDSICADPIAAYYEAGGDLKAALGVRDRELAFVEKKGMLHRACQVQVERCRLLARAGELTPSDLDAARLAAGRLRSPEWFLEKLDRIAGAGRPEA